MEILFTLYFILLFYTHFYILYRLLYPILLRKNDGHHFQKLHFYFLSIPVLISRATRHLKQRRTSQASSQFLSSGGDLVPPVSNGPPPRGRDRYQRNLSADMILRGFASRRIERRRKRAFSREVIKGSIVQESTRSPSPGPYVAITREKRCTQCSCERETKDEVEDEE